MCKSQNPLYWYRLSVSANMEKIISEYYRYRPIWKFNLSVIIGIGQYEKTCTHFFFFNSDSKGPLLGRLSTKGQLRTNQPAIAMMSTFTPYTQQEMNALLKTAETYLCTSSYVH